VVVYNRLAYTGKLPYHKIGGTVRFDADDVDAYIQASRRGRTATLDPVATEPEPVAAGQ
jgi:hypothetical protein